MIYELFTRAMGLPPEQRESFLRSICADEAMLTQVLLLIAQDTKNIDFTLSHDFANESDAFLHQNQLQVGDVISVYEIVAELGQGGMGTVYQAKRIDGAFEQTVAIKVISSHVSELFDTHKLANEASFMAKLNHGNICTVHDAGKTQDGLQYIVMENISGQPVTEYADKQQLTIKQRLALFIRIAKAVEFAHQHQVIHADIKPHNILVDERGEPHILDFGIATLFDTTHSELTHYYRAFSPQYASPELMETGHVTTLTDVFALGRLLSVLLNLSTAQGKDPALKYAKELKAISDKALHKEPQKRYQSVTQMVADVALFNAGFVSQAYSATAIYRCKKFIFLRHPLIASLVFISLLLLMMQGRSLYNNQLELQEQFRQQTLITDKLSDFLTLLNPLTSNQKNLDAKALLAQINTSLDNDVALSAESKQKIKLALANTYQGLDDLSLSEKLYLEVLANTKHLPRKTLYFEAAYELAKLYNNDSADTKVIQTFSDLAQPFTTSSPTNLPEALFYDQYLRARARVEDHGYSGPALRQRKAFLNEMLTDYKTELSAQQRVLIEFDLAKVMYHDLPRHFFHSFFQLTPEQFALSHQPILLEIKALLLEAQEDAQKHNLSTLQAQIISFEAQINAELDLHEDAQRDLLAAETILETVVDKQHSAMLAHLDSKARVYYYSQPELAVKAIEQKIAITQQQDTAFFNYTIRNLDYLHYLLLQMGEHQRAKEVLEQAVALYLSDATFENHILTTTIIINMIYNNNDANETYYVNEILNNEILRQLLIPTNPFKQGAFASYQDYLDYTGFDVKTKENYVPWRVEDLSTRKPNFINIYYIYYWRIDRLKLLWLDSFYSQSTTYQQLVDAVNAFTWSAQEKRYSPFVVDVYLTAAEALVNIADFVHAQSQIDQAKEMLLSTPLHPGNAYEARLLLVQGELALKQNNMSLAREKLAQAKPLLEKHYPEFSLYNMHFKELLGLLKETNG